MGNLDKAKIKLKEDIRIIEQLQRGSYGNGTTEYDSNMRAAKATINEALNLVD